MSIGQHAAQGEKSSTGQHLTGVVVKTRNFGILRAVDPAWGQVVYQG
jgi:hypothetical protein